MNTGAAFTGGSGLAMADVATLVAGVATAAVLLWAGWALLSTWRGWAVNRVRGEVLQAAAVRIGLVLILIFWLFLGNL